MNFIKIYGLRRTGTNYLQWLLANNFRQLVVLVDAFRWKHGLPSNITPEQRYKFIDTISHKDYKLSADLQKFPGAEVLSDEIHYIMCVKDPYSWYISICKWSGLNPFPTDKDKLEKMYLWNYMGERYKKFCCGGTNRETRIILRYEDLLSGLTEVLNTLSEITGLRLSTKTKVVDCDNDVYSGQSFEARRKFYIKKEYLCFYSPTDFAAMRDFIDADVAKYLEYKIQ